MEQDVKDLITQGDKLFGKRVTLLSLWQEIADNFYPERADFTVTRYLGMEFAGHLTSSYPLLVRRDLGNTFSSMLRPSDKDWFMYEVEEAKNDNDSQRWLEWAQGVQKRAMYDKNSLFNRATKEGDHDFAAFGQCVITVELNQKKDGLLYRCWHLRDVAWAEDEEGKISDVHRKWNPDLRTLNAIFKGKISPKLANKLEKEPYSIVKCRHVITKNRGDKFKTPWVSTYVDIENEFVMEEIGMYHNMYVIPRWQTVSGSQYAYSPATVAGLPDARLLQAMSLTLLEAGEKATNPPLVAVEDAVRSDLGVYAGGVTWVSAEYDERLGEVLRPITQDLRGLPTGLDMVRDTRQMLTEAFFLNKIALPQITREMTAFEAGQRVQEYIRQALPLFEPMEQDYNGQICDVTFDLMMRSGAFGSMQDIPSRLSGKDIKFKFVSPLRDAVEKEKGTVFQNATGIISTAISLDPSSAGLVDVRTTLRDVLSGIGVPAKWVNDEQKMKEIDQAHQEQMAQQDTLAKLQQGAGIAKTLGEANQTMPGGAGMNPNNYAAP